MSMNVSGRKGTMAAINITPYIDILLVLLIIFMVITPVHQMDLEVKIPQIDNTPRPPDPTIIVVSVGEAAYVAVNQEPTTMLKLGEKLRNIYNARDNNHKSMFISASARLPYSDIVRVIDIAKGAGVGDIGLISEEIH
jgi:biopolymer transport protein ExbD